MKCERRENVRYIEGQPFRDTPPPKPPRKPEPFEPEWVRRAREGRLPAKTWA